MTTYNIDRDVPTPEGMQAVVEVCNFFRDNRLKVGESVFVADFPVEHLTVLTASILTYHLVPIYTQADSVYGGKGVRIHSLSDVKGLSGAFATGEKIEQRVVGDWKAIRSGSNKWNERISVWFGFDITKKVFAWSETKNQVLVYDDASSIGSGEYEITPHSAFVYMSDAGVDYRAGEAKPQPASKSREHDINTWVGFKQRVWAYSSTQNKVVQYNSRSEQDGDARRLNSGKPGFEDAPLYAWLGYNAALAYASAVDVKDNYDLGDL